MKQEQRLTGHREPFDYYLSAFLSAGMSFRDGFQIRQDRPRNTAIKTWRAQWENNLTSEEKSLYDFMPWRATPKTCPKRRLSGVPAGSHRRLVEPPFHRCKTTIV